MASIGVMLYLRTNAPYLRKFLFPTLERLEHKHCDTVFHYYIYENDSTDDTVDAVREFLQDRGTSRHERSVFMSNNMGLSEETSGTSFARIQRMAYVRNQLLSSVRERLLAHTWCLFVDSNIYFDDDCLEKLLLAQRDHGDICMLGCMAIEVLPNQGLLPVDKAVIPYVTSYHYYDTFAFVNMDNRIPYPACLNPECVVDACTQYREHNGGVWDVSLPFIDVRSAWGGFVLVSSSVLGNNPGVCWKPLAVLNNNSLCEHLHFCDAVRAASNKRIVIVPSVCVYWKKDDW